MRADDGDEEPVSGQDSRGLWSEKVAFTLMRGFVQTVTAVGLVCLCLWERG
jgi:hypothetical protein